MPHPRQIKLTVTKYGFLHVFNLKAYLVLLSKSFPLQENKPFLVSKNCLGKQFTYKFLGTSSVNESFKNVLCSKSILIIVQ